MGRIYQWHPYTSVRMLYTYMENKTKDMKVRQNGEAGLIPTQMMSDIYFRLYEYYGVFVGMSNC